MQLRQLGRKPPASVLSQWAENHSIPQAGALLRLHGSAEAGQPAGAAVGLFASAQAGLLAGALVGLVRQR